MNIDLKALLRNRKSNYRGEEIRLRKNFGDSYIFLFKQDINFHTIFIHCA